MSETKTIKQLDITVELLGRSLVVRRMKWKAARTFIQNLAKHLSGFNANGLQEIFVKLPDLLNSVDSLATELVVGSTDLNPAAFDELNVLEAATVLQAAVELNLGPDLKNSFAGIVATIQALTPAMKTSPGGELTPS